MLQAHSFLWNYLWVAPNVLLILFGFLLWRRDRTQKFRAFLVFAFLSSLGDLAAYLADIIPSVTPTTFWRVIWVGLIVESILKFLVIGEVFSHLLNPYPAIARLGKNLLTGFGTILVLVAAVVAAFARPDSKFDIIFDAHIVEQTVFLVETGLIIFLFIFAAHFHLGWERLSFGILLGLGISSCVHLATWAIIANTNPSEHMRMVFAFLNMGAYHISVLTWFYYLLVPGRVRVKPGGLPPSADILAVWNRELERLLQQ